MDPSLLKEREAFKRRALDVPAVERKKVKPDDSKREKANKRPKPAHSHKPRADFEYKATTGTSQYKFSILALIVKHMKKRHQLGYSFPLTIEEILDETKQMDIGARNKHWLITEALISNPKIDVVDGDTYKFKPKLDVKNRRGLLRLLDSNDQKGLGGIFFDDVEEALPKAALTLKKLEDQIIQIVRPSDKKIVLYYNDKSSAFEVDDDLKKLWRSVTVEGVDEVKIDEYLSKHGITSMQDIGPKKVTVQKRKGNRKRKPMTKTKDNEHLDYILKDYSEVQK